MTQTATRSQHTVTVVLSLVYLLLLVGLVLFKFPFDYQSSPRVRDVNLIPFAGSFTGAGAFRFGEVIENVLVFLPFGLYLGMLAPRWSMAGKIAVILGTTIAFEAIQYVFAIGRSDITDVIANTVGGLVGLGICALGKRTLGTRAQPVFNVIGLVLTVLVVVFFAYLAAHSWSSGRR